MEDNYECPRCHNVFPSSNRIMHDARCTEEKPLPLDASRVEMQKEKEEKEEKEKEEKEKEENKMKIEEEPPKKVPEVIKKPSSGEFPDVFECDICHQLCMEKERKDHMLCHNLEKEDRNREENYEVSPQEIERQKAIEKQIERNKRYNERNNQRNNNQNNVFPNLGDSDLDIGDPIANLGMGNFLGNLSNAIYGQQMSNMPHMSNNNGSNRRNNNNNRSNGTSNVVIHFSSSGPNGQRIERTYHSNGGNPNQEMPQMPQMPQIFFPSSSSSSSSRRRRISFFDFNNGLFGDDFITQFLQRMGSRENPTDEEILSELPETQIEDASKLDPEKKNCLIYLEDFKNGDKAIILPCIHIFHNECIKNWLKTQNTCPICKFKLTGENMNNPGSNGGDM